MRWRENQRLQCLSGQQANRYQRRSQPSQDQSADKRKPPQRRRLIRSAGLSARAFASAGERRKFPAVGAVIRKKRLELERPAASEFPPAVPASSDDAGSADRPGSKCLSCQRDFNPSSDSAPNQASPDNRALDHEANAAMCETWAQRRIRRDCDSPPANAAIVEPQVHLSIADSLERRT